MSATATRVPRATRARTADPRLQPVNWRMPSQRSARTRAVVMAGVCLPLAIWYLAWLLQGQRVGDHVLFGLLIAAEAFNLFQAIGFWWTCGNQRLRGGKLPTSPDLRVDVMIPVYDEPVEVVEPTLAAACALRGADAKAWLLDDGRRDELSALAARYDAGYLRRADRAGAKAGNLNHAISRTDAPYIVVVDCDHVTLPEFLERTLGLLEEPGVGFVQTPQHYANTASGPVCAAAAAQQNLFFGPISRGKDGMDTMFCCGTNVVFRREALQQVGGFPEDSLTEDFELSIRLHERGWRSVYLSEVVASGLGPEDMASYVSQQQRWARGCLSSIPTVLRSRLPWRLRLQYLLSATYFLSGWTLVLYMSLPVIRLLFGLQPLARITADQFLIHFAPYYCGALAAVALAGSGSYTFGAFALSACNFWIHVQATINAVLRRAARFVVTPKRGVRTRQPRAVTPALAAIGVLLGSSVYGLLGSTGPATLNNVAFAALHSSILAIGIAPALRLSRSPLLAPEPPRPARRRSRRIPKPVFIAALAVVLAIPVGVSLIGSRGFSVAPDMGQQAHTAVESFLTRYVDPDGRVVRRDQGGDTVSEGQAYGMLLAVSLDDRSQFQTIWNWTERHLLLSDGLLASQWADGRVVSDRPATDADIDAARALVLAGKRFGSDSLRSRGIEMARAVLRQETVQIGNATVLVAGPWARSSPAVVNPSYFSPRAFADLERADPDPRWNGIVASSRTIAAKLAAGGRSLPPDWASVTAPVPAGANPIGAPNLPTGGGPSPVSSFDAVRVAIRSAESCVATDRRLAASLWPIYRRDPGRDAYALDGTPQTSQQHAVSLVAAAAAAKAAGDARDSAKLLGQAQAQDRAHPTYYGSAWVALGRVMLTTNALGSCAR
ncbi:MAG: glycosyl hydrolase family 8 [Solirubrobacteraceae bacterium]